MCKSIKIKEAQNYEATAGTRTAGQIKCTNVRYLTVTLARIANESSRAPSRQGTRYWLFNGKAVCPHPGVKSPTQSKTITNLRVRGVTPNVTRINLIVTLNKIRVTWDLLAGW
jgi:hypothetical protein